MEFILKCRCNNNKNGRQEKVRKDKQRSTKHTHTTKDRVTRTPLKTGVNSGAPIAPIVAHFCVGVEINFQVD
jgi:hypothetical protein